GDSSWRLQRESSTDTLMFGGNGLTPMKVVGTKSVNDGRWHHVVGTYDGETLCLYVDGELDNSVSASGTFNSNNFNVRIGSNAEKADRYWNGSLHDARVYDWAMSPADVAELYGLVGHWPLNEIGGTTATDAALTGNHGN